MSYNLDDVMRRADMDPNDILVHSKLQLMLKYQQAKDDNPKLNQHQICGFFGTSKSKIYRNRIYFNMDSFHRYRVPVKHKKPKPKPESDNDSNNDNGEAEDEVKK